MLLNKSENQPEISLSQPTCHHRFCRFVDFCLRDHILSQFFSKLCGQGQKLGARGDWNPVSLFTCGLNVNANYQHSIGINTTLWSVLTLKYC